MALEPSRSLDTVRAADPVPGPRRRRAWLAPALLGLTLLAALLLRLREAGRAPFWFDEIFTVWIVRGGTSRMLELLRHDMHPPLFFAAVLGWRALVGEHTLLLRLLPIGFGVGLVLAVYALARDAFGRPAGMLAAALVAVHRDLVYAAQELRSFGMLWCLEAVLVWAALRWAASWDVVTAWRAGRLGKSLGVRRRRDGAIYVLAGAAGLYTHYLAGTVLAATFVWGAARVAREPRRLAAWVGLHAAIAVAFLPQLPTFLRQLAVNHVSHWVPKPHPSDLIDLARHASFGSLALALPFAALGLFAFRRSGSRAAAWLLSTVVVLPVAVAYVLTKNGAHLFTVRYMLYVAPFALVMVAGGVVALPRRWLATAAALVLIALGARSLAITPAHEEPAELARARARIAAAIRPGDRVFCLETHSLLFLRQYEPRWNAVLVPPDGPLPYYEGADVVPAAAITTRAAFDSTRAAGSGWWAIRVHHVGVDGTTTAARLVAAAGMPERVGGLVSVWAGRR